ncbi:MAG: glycosyltransferase family 4 protein [Bacteroidales bacterium]|nr:glycosyltransferase family 4 protein [Bacteroidales bacterium]
MYRVTIGVWGQFGDGGKIADGQAVRTTIITNELKRRYGNEAIKTINTNAWRKKPLRFLLSSISLLRHSDVFIIAPADNGFKVFVPILDFFNRFFKRRILYVVIGGFLPRLLKEKPMYIKMVNRFAESFVQTENIKKDLEEIGIKSISILSNPKRLNTIQEEDVHLIKDDKIKVCLFSRIYADKGVEDAIEAVTIANKTLGGQFIHLDLYGLVPDFYKARLKELLEQNTGVVSYMGIIDYDKTVETLKDYFVMLFPTYYHGEGFPGNVIDAYNSALPIIATDWLYNSDVVLDNTTGLLVPVKNPETLSNAIIKLYNNRELRQELAINSLREVPKYAPDKVLADFYKIIDNE